MLVTRVDIDETSIILTVELVCILLLGNAENAQDDDAIDATTAASKDALILNRSYKLNFELPEIEDNNRSLEEAPPDEFLISNKVYNSVLCC